MSRAQSTIPYAQAMQLLSVSRSTLDRMCDRELFTVVASQGVRGRGKRLWLWADEVVLFAERRDALAVRDLRYRMRRIKGGAR